ncbi:type II and III secretion system protein family protein [Phenylobacterium sp. LH3H17]|uniref:type II and III secretion system protein family protein n=1 Tax=Phenylobacterium sp. LH3H17 TaxID=2903901 RepID=UPI0020C9CCF4|nr:type II and III secretion system protein family protein [Phenylobacterium sp. LH3H17]UTP38826.1 type II and III secretion system protein family protein [Phenylobacterium sp. LH3H17]
MNIETIKSKGSLGATWRLARALLLAAALCAPSAPAMAQAVGGGYELVVPAGKSEVLEAPTYTDLMIANPEIADVLPLSTHSVYVVGKKMGSTVLSIYGPGKRLISSINVVVSADVGGLKSRLHEVMPEENGVNVSAANESIVLSGRVSSGPKVAQMVALAETYAPGKVVNMLSVQGVQQVMLSVRFVEMERSIAKQLRVNTSSPSNGAPGRPFSSQAGEPYVATGDSLKGGSFDGFGVFQALIRSGDVNLDILFDALETKGLVKTLAEPTLVAMSGDTATFLAGGEFPIPIAQNTQGGERTITVEFKEFGISLGFTPTVLDDGVINLIVAPEVSSIDPTNSVTTGDLTIPGLKVRRARTTIELRDGESFTIAGLLKDEYRSDIRQYPFIGDLPVIGALFRSSGYQKNQTELVLVVTPHLATPTRGRAATPADRFVPPSDFELFVFGAQRASLKARTPEERALMSVDPAKGGLEGGYGHVLH